MLDANGCPPQVEFADVHCVQCHVPGILTGRKDVILSDGVIIEFEFGHIVLGVDHILKPARSSCAGIPPQRKRTPRCPPVCRIRKPVRLCCHYQCSTCCHWLYICCFSVLLIPHRWNRCRHRALFRESKGKYPALIEQFRSTLFSLSRFD